MRWASLATAIEVPHAIFSGRVVYEQIVDEGETRVDYLLIDNEAELSNCFSINHHIKYKLGCINKI